MGLGVWSTKGKVSTKIQMCNMEGHSELFRISIGLGERIPRKIDCLLVQESNKTS